VSGGTKIHAGARIRAASIRRRRSKLRVARVFMTRPIAPAPEPVKASHVGRVR
jgi:hypothetical protein